MSGWGALGDVLGGGIFGSSQTDVESGRLRTAQTESALEQARSHQLANMLTESQAKNREAFKTRAAENGMDPNIVDATLGNFGADYAAAAEGGLRTQEFDARKRLGDVMTTPEEGIRMERMISGEYRSPFEFHGEDVINRLDPVAAGQQAIIQTTPKGLSEIGENKAQAAAALDPKLHTSAARAGVDPETGMEIPNDFMINSKRDLSQPYTETNPYFVPMPNTKASPTYSPPMGVRERQGVASVIHAGLESSQRLHTITDMPYGATQGVVSTAGTPGAGLAEALSKNIRWAMSSSEIQDYNVAASTMLRNLATLEIVGRYNPSKAALESMDTLLFKKGEDVYTKMQKMADLRNIIENTMNTVLITYPNERDTEIGKTARATIASVRQSVPWTMDDVVAYRAASRKNPGITFEEATKRHLLNKPVRAGGAPSADGASPTAGASQPRSAPQPALDSLAQHPELADQFKAKYGYLP